MEATYASIIAVLLGVVSGWIITIERRMGRKIDAKDVPPRQFEVRVERIEKHVDDVMRSMHNLEIHVAECKKRLGDE